LNYEGRANMYVLQIINQGNEAIVRRKLYTGTGRKLSHFEVIGSKAE
jgi:hypothetical protein